MRATFHQFHYVLFALLLLGAGRAAAVEFSVQSNPPGATIAVDGRELPQKTPAIISVEAGDHDFTLKLEGRKTVTRRLQVSGRGFASFDLPPAVGSQTITVPAAPRAAAPAPAPAANPYSTRPGDFGPTVTIRYRKAPTPGATTPRQPEINLLPMQSAPARPAPKPAAAPVAEPSDAPAQLPSGPKAGATPQSVDEEIDLATFNAEFIASIETELGEEALLLAETSDPGFGAGDTVMESAAGDAADAEAFAGATATATGLTPAAAALTPAEEEEEPPPGPMPPSKPYCAPAPQVWWPSSAESRMARAAANLPTFPDKFNVLLLGLDRRDRRGILATGAEIPLNRLRRIPARSDVVMVFQFDLAENRVRVVSVPRDTRVKFGRGDGKINAAYAFGREPLTRRVVSSFLDIPIHRSVVVDWRAAKHCINLYKGLSLGYNNFSEKEMFWHLRKRSFARGDFQRIERQQKFLAGAWAEFLKLMRQAREDDGPTAVVTREMIELAMDQAYQTVETDLSWDEVRLLNYAFRDYDPTTMVMTQVPGVGVLAGGTSDAVYYLSPTPRHSFNDLIVRAEGSQAQP